MADLFPITTIDKIREIERELAMRLEVYPRWVDSGKLRRDVADRRLAVLTAIRRDYLTLAMSEDTHGTRATGLSATGTAGDPGQFAAGRATVDGASADRERQDADRG